MRVFQHMINLKISTQHFKIFKGAICKNKNDIITFLLTICKQFVTKLKKLS